MALWGRFSEAYSVSLQASRDLDKLAKVPVPFRAMPTKPEPPMLTPSQVALLRFRYLTEDTATVKSLADETGLPRYRVASLLKGSDFDSFRDGLHASMAQQAQTILARSAEQAATQWVRSMGPAADKGDHRPMRDLLTAVHAIDPEASAPTLIVQIGVTSNDVQILTLQPKPATLPVSSPLQVIEAQKIEPETE